MAPSVMLGLLGAGAVVGGAAGYYFGVRRVLRFARQIMKETPATPVKRPGAMAEPARTGQHEKTTDETR